MTKKELARKWDITERLVNSNKLTKQIKYRKIEASNGARCLVDFDEEDVERFEKEHNIPSDPISIKGALAILGISNQSFYYYKQKGAFTKIGWLNERVFLYSMSEVLDLKAKREARQ